MQEQQIMSQEEKRKHNRWHRHPFWLCMIGLAFMIGGWKASTYVPPRAENAQLAELRQLAQDPDFRDRLDQFGRNQQPPPFETPGRLLFFGGVLLFVGAMVTMSRKPSPSTEEEPVA
jgi:hypothetical protein